MEKSVTLTYVLETHRPDAGGRCRVKIRLTHQRKPQLVSLPKAVSCSPEEWDALQTHHIYRDTDARRSKAIAKYRDLPETYRYLHGEGSPLAMALQIVRHFESEGEPFSMAAFRLYFGRGLPAKRQSGFGNDVLAAFAHTVAAEKRHDRTGNAASYADAAASFARFFRESHPRASTLTFQAVSVAFLSAYERWMLTNGKSITTVAIYTRQLRAIWNLGIAKGVADRDGYPFGKRGYLIPTAKNPKKAVSGADVARLLAYRVEYDGFERRSHDFWMLSYLLNGLNLKDILSLRHADVDWTAQTITVFRQKTARSSRRRITCYLTDRSREIVRRYMTPVGQGGGLLFPYLDQDMGAGRRDAVVAQFNKATTNWIRKIAVKLGIENTRHLTAIAARHSFATTLMRAGVPGKFIQDSLGHTSFSTTENYLGSFEENHARQHLESLLNPA